MAQLTLDGDSFTVAPFTLDKLERAADDIDAVNAALNTRDGSWKSMVSSYRPVLRIAEIGLAGTDTPLTADELMQRASLRDAPAIFAFFTTVLEEAGLQQLGEPVAETEAAMGQVSAETTSRGKGNRSAGKSAA